jgi:hypothetical protein
LRKRDPGIAPPISQNFECLTSSDTFTHPPRKKISSLSFHLILTYFAGRIRLLPLQRCKIRRQRRLLHKSPIPKLTSNISDKAPEPNEALKWLHSTATSYAAFIPGAKGYVDSAFKDLEKVQQKHGQEVDDIV